MASESEYLKSLFGLGGKTALITGGTRGIGAALSVALYVYLVPLTHESKYRILLRLSEGHRLEQILFSFSEIPVVARMRNLL